MGKMIKGVEIKFSKKDNHYFEDTYEDDIDANLLIIALLETVNDICKDNNLDYKEQLTKYMSMGSVDDCADKETRERIFTLFESKEMKKYKKKQKKEEEKGNE